MLLRAGFLRDYDRDRDRDGLERQSHSNTLSKPHSVAQVLCTGRQQLHMG